MKEKLSWQILQTKGQNPYGNTVIAIYRLLKNGVDSDEYVLYSKDLLKEASLGISGQGIKRDSDLGKIPYSYLKIDEWKKAPPPGSAHCSLIPYWGEVLGKKKMDALQLSARQGKLQCEDLGERVGISGHALTYLKGSIWADQSASKTLYYT